MLLSEAVQQMELAESIILRVEREVRGPAAIGTFQKARKRLAEATDIIVDRQYAQGDKEVARS